MANYLDKMKGFVQHISSDVLLLATTSYKVEPSKGRKDVQTLEEASQRTKTLQH